MTILAINFNHDGAAAIVADGVLAAYVNTERYSRLKKHPGVRAADIHEALDQAGLTLKDIDLVQLLNLNSMDSPDVPKLHRTNLKETWPEFWINQSFTQVQLLGHTLPCQVSKQHHLYHAALAYLYSPFGSAVSFACDPVGAEAYFFSDGDILEASRQPLVAPEIYAKVAAVQFGSGLIGAGKLMGLAPYGRDSRDIDYSEVLKLPPNEAYRMLVERATVDPIYFVDGKYKYNATLAFYAQELLELELCNLFKVLHRKCESLKIDPHLCLSGGTALNSSANHRCFSQSEFRHLYLHPACGDDGMPIGSALFHWQQVAGCRKVLRSNAEAMYSRRTYETTLRAEVGKFSSRVQIVDTKDYTKVAARMILDGKVIGWFQGASEIGPRALGNRSILADPRSSTMRGYLNTEVKRRETFRPFAPAVLAESASRYFGISESPFMLRIAPIQQYNLPAVTHVDGTARFQTVSETDNPAFHRLIAEFERLSGVPMVLNTSFNGKGQPIVQSPSDAIDCMLSAGLDAVVFPEIIAFPAGRPNPLEPSPNAIRENDQLL